MYSISDAVQNMRGQGLKAALLEDLGQTCRRHVGIVLGLATFWYNPLSNRIGLFESDGFAEATIDPKTGDYIRYRDVRSGVDIHTTVIREKQGDGTWKTCTEESVRKPDGKWETRKYTSRNDPL